MFTIHVQHRLDPETRALLQAVAGHLKDLKTSLFQRLNEMSSDLQSKLDALKGDVATLTAADVAAEALLSGLTKQLADALAAAKDAGATADQLAALDDLHATLTTSTAGLAAAVAANTPAAAPAPEPVPAATTAGEDTVSAPTT